MTSQVRESLLPSLPSWVWCALLILIFIGLIVRVYDSLDEVEEKPTIFCKKSPFTRFIIQKCQMMNQPFFPPLLVRNRHIQTLLSVIFSRADVSFNREFLRVPDQGLIALDWGINEKQALCKTGTVLIIIPSLTGDAQQVSFLCQQAMKQGFRPVVFNRRGHGGTPLLSPKLQSFSESQDVRHVIKYIRGRFPCTKIVAVGISLGTSVLMSYLGEYGSSSRIQSAVCISPVFDPRSVLTTTLPPLYQSLGTYYMKKTICSHPLVLSNVMDLDAVLQSRSLFELECIVQKIQDGKQDREEYWEANNPIKAVDEVVAPVLFVISEDDPLVPWNTVPRELFDTFINFMLVRTKRGGHAGFLGDTNLEPWADKLSIDYLTATFEFLKRVNKQEPQL